MLSYIKYAYFCVNVIILFGNFALIVIIVIINVCTITFDTFNASLLNKILISSEKNPFNRIELETIF